MSGGQALRNGPERMSRRQMIKWSVASIAFLAAFALIVYASSSVWGFSVQYFLMGIIPLLIFAYVLVATRRKPGRRYDKKPPEQADADLDNWTGWR